VECHHLRRCENNLRIVAVTDAARKLLEQSDRSWAWDIETTCLQVSTLWQSLSNLRNRSEKTPERNVTPASWGHTHACARVPKPPHHLGQQWCILPTRGHTCVVVGQQLPPIHHRPFGGIGRRPVLS